MVARINDKISLKIEPDKVCIINGWTMHQLKTEIMDAIVAAYLKEKGQIAVDTPAPRKEEFYNTEFPKSLYDVVSMARPVRHNEIELAEKETLIDLVVLLKEKELEWDIKYHNLLNERDDNS